MFRNVLLVSLMILGCSYTFNTAQAASCYSAAETEAEQGLRIHSELMVIGLNCQKMIRDKGDLYIQYREFTRKNQTLLSGYETTMINYYRNQGVGSAETKLHDLRTRLANKISGEAARMQPNVFCHTYGGRIAQANQMDQAKLRRWAQAVYKGYEPTRPSCERTAAR